MTAAIQTLQWETSVSTVVHKPGRELDDPKALLLGFLDYYRSSSARSTA